MLLDPYGRPVADTEEVWRVQAMFEWLSDARVRRRVLNRRIMSLPELRAFGGFLDLELRTRAAQEASPMAPPHATIDRGLLKRVMLAILRDPVVRRSIARAMSWRTRGTGMTPSAVRAELQREREELEVEVAAGSAIREMQ